MLDLFLTIKAREISVPVVNYVQLHSYQRYQDYSLVRQTRVSSTQDSSITFRSEQLKSQTNTKLKSIEDPKIPKSCAKYG